MRRWAEEDGWQTLLFADRAGWVVRLTRTAVVTERSLARDRREVEQLAQRCDGVVRGFVLEEMHTDDWVAALATQIVDRMTAQRAPVQRTPGAANDLPAARASRTA